MNRRTGTDRRKNTFPEIKFLFFYGRRKGIRRIEDEDKIIYFDQYSLKFLLPIIALLFLSMMDGLLTLFLIDNGAREINPIMAYFLQFGPLTFITVKYFLTGFSAIVLLIFGNMFITKLKIYTQSLFRYAIGLFSAVVGWELFLIFYVLG